MAVLPNPHTSPIHFSGPEITSAQLAAALPDLITAGLFSGYGWTQPVGGVKWFPRVCL